MFQLFFVTVFLFLVLPVRAKFGDPKAGVILYANDGHTRSGLLGHDHRCTEYPQRFPGARAKNVGSVHCTLYTNTNCTGTLHIVPAHYGIDLPNEKFGSIIC